VRDSECVERVTGGAGCGIVVNMSSKAPEPKGSKPSDLKAAGQAAVDAAHAAVEAAQTVATSALRIPPASVRLAAQLPDLLENLATTTERLNSAMDNLDRYLALAEPTLRTMDRLLPQLEALVATGTEIYGALSRLPGVATLSRMAGVQSSDDDSHGKRKK
jgi:ABC-type transporter Mla subunit MlaD